MSDTETGWTPGPWEYVPSTEHHGPYVAGPYGGDVCDCYTMTDPSAPSVRNGGKSKPVLFFSEMADPNARLIAAAPELYEALKELLAQTDPHRNGRGEDAELDARINAVTALHKARNGDK